MSNSKSSRFRHNFTLALLSLLAVAVGGALLAPPAAASGGSPIGIVDVLAVSQGQLRVSGWTLDPDTTDSIPVHIYADGLLLTGVLADRDRPDIAALYGMGAAHGFETTLAFPPGTAQVCVYAINVAGAGSNPAIGCKHFTHQPIGVIDSLWVSGGQAWVSGWTLDPDTTDSIPIHVYLNGRLLFGALASGHRPDLQAAFGLGAAHGFDLAFPVGEGPGELCIYAINAVGPSGNPALGCRQINASPIGVIDTHAQGSGQVSVAGWAFDPDTPNPVAIHVYVDGQFAGSGTANQPRPDVGQVYGRGPSSGYQITVPASANAKQVCVYALNASGGGGSPQLGCRSLGTSPASTPASSPANAERWIEYNISNYCLYLHQGEAVVWSTCYTANGKPSTPTPAGNFRVYSKVQNTCMPNSPSPKPLCNIHWVTYWGQGGYAFHEAWWMQPHQVGTGISHGCVNMTVGAAKVVYDFAEIGMRVWVHR